MNKDIETGKAALGIEFGSTRIKAVLIGCDYKVLAVGAHDWENHNVNGVWTYPLEEVWDGLRDAYAKMAAKVKQQYGVPVKKLSAIGFSAMMHGYLAFDKDGRQLAEFRTWRNTMTGEAAEKLSAAFNFNIPQRWSIAHLYQAILNGESHVGEIAFFTTLAGYVHWALTGEKVLGVGDASGMFPIDSNTNQYDDRMLAKFGELAAEKGFKQNLKDILPRVLIAGEDAGRLTAEGAKMLDPSGELEPGILFAPPEGDAGTGMVATNAVAPRTGNVSAGTSVFAMVVLEKSLKRAYPEIDMVTTPTGKAVAMVHCNNCTDDLNAWVGVLGEAAKTLGATFTTDELYQKLFAKAEEGAADCHGVVTVNYLSGEPVTGAKSGRPLVTRVPGVKFTLADFMRANVMSAITSLAIGMELLTREGVTIEKLLGHGGYFKQPIGAKMMAASLGVPITCMETAGEGGPWGMAVLASFAATGQGRTLEQFLNDEVFAGAASQTTSVDATSKSGFLTYIQNFKLQLPPLVEG